MVFSSAIFLTIFFPLVFTIYFILPRKARNIFLLLASIAFYAWGAPKFIFAILLTTTVDFYLVRTLSNITDARQKKLFLILSIALNAGMLFYFKYCNFFVENANELLHAFGVEKEIRWTQVILPIGISFYTFESLTYVIDVYRGVHKPLKNFWHYQLYILLFPKLIAGPIIRYHEISDQITGRLGKENSDDKLMGFYRFCIGLGKKVLIANTVGSVADSIFESDPNILTTSYAWLGMMAYTFQIYFDFSGYSDMAIGMGRMFGFRFPENFDNPYISGSITEFWRRWHITLGNWMKNYLYIPLGGNKVESRARLYFNLWLVFLLSGLWHGAAWTFIFWGIYHGMLLILERIFLLDLYKKLGRLIPVALTFFLVSIGWVLFRSDSLTQALQFIKTLFVYKGGIIYLFTDNEFLFFFILAAVFSFFALVPAGKRLQEKIYYSKYNSIGYIAATFCSLVIFLLCLASITSSSFNPFIYFRF